MARPMKKKTSGKSSARKGTAKQTGKRSTTRTKKHTVGKRTPAKRKTKKQRIRETKRKKMWSRIKRWLARILAVVITGFFCLFLIDPQIQTRLSAIPGFGRVRTAAETFLGEVSANVSELVQGITTRSGNVQLPDYLQSTASSAVDPDSVPAYSGTPYVVINGNVPYFTEAELTTTAYETYGALDGLGRCQAAVACIGQEIMPTEERGTIGQVRPSGWHTVKYDCIDGLYLYNRCHLIGYQLAGENANVQNLITGTRYLNVEGMLPFENQVASYVQTTGNHVMYRVTPVFEGGNLVASGVEMEAYSVEDRGAGVCFHVYVYNVQPGVIIDYTNGESRSAAQ